VLDQTYEDIELIVVDDGSTDGTEKVVRSFNNPRIRYIRHEQNRGAAAARNTGIRAARGEYIAFQDSDDVWLPEKLEKQMHVLSNASDEVGIVYTDMWRIKEGRKIYWRSPRNTPEDGIIYKNAIERVFNIGLATVLIRKSCFDKVGFFDENLSRFIDFEFFIRLSKDYCFLHIDNPLVYYYYTDKSISTDDITIIPTSEFILKKYGKDMDKKSLAWFQFTVGNILCQKGKINDGRNYIFRGLKLCPLNIKYLGAAILLFIGKDAYTNIINLKRTIKKVKKPLELRQQHI